MKLFAKEDTDLQSITEKYGDLVYDLCYSILRSHANAQNAFRQVVKILRATPRQDRYRAHERPWILKLTVEVLRKFSAKYSKPQTPAERMMLDATQEANARIAQFDSFFHRLTIDEQLILLIRDKHGVSYDELAAIMNMPEGSVKLKRDQALRTLESWVWE